MAVIQQAQSASTFHYSIMSLESGIYTIQNCGPHNWWAGIMTGGNPFGEAVRGVLESYKVRIQHGLAPACETDDLGASRTAYVPS
jgi:hypothetical protein